MIHRKPLQPADVDRVIHHSAAALGLAGMLAHIGAGGGKGIVLPNQADRVVVPLLPDQGHIAGDIHMGRTDGHAGHRVAQAADRNLLRVSNFSRAAFWHLKESVRMSFALALVFSSTGFH